jgi:hypothetical protein
MEQNTDNQEVLQMNEEYEINEEELDLTENIIKVLEMVDDF